MIWECAAVVGTLVAAEPRVDYTPLFYNCIELEKIWQLKDRAGDYDAFMQVMPTMKTDLAWWVEHAGEAC